MPIVGADGNANFILLKFMWSIFDIIYQYIHYKSPIFNLIQSFIYNNFLELLGGKVIYFHLKYLIMSKLKNRS